MLRPSGISPCVPARGNAECASPSSSVAVFTERQRPQPQQQHSEHSHDGAAAHIMEVPVAALGAEVRAPGDRRARRRDSYVTSSSSSSTCTSNSGSISIEGQHSLPSLACVKAEEPSKSSSVSAPTCGDAQERGSAEAAAPGPSGAAAAECGEAAAADDPFRSLQLLLSDMLGVLAMLRPAGSLALPRGVAAAVSRARQAAQAALKRRRSQGPGGSSSNREASSSIGAALAAAANTAAVALEQRNPQFAFHQFTILAASSFDELSPYVVHYMRDLLEVLEQRRSLLRLLRSQERSQDRCDSQDFSGERAQQGGAPAATAQQQPDNLRLLLQVFLAYCPAAMLDTVCDRLAAAYGQALLNEALPKQQQQQQQQVTAGTVECAAPAEQRATSLNAAEDSHVVAAAAADTGRAATGEIAATDAPRSLARPGDDEVAVSVAALLGQRSFVQRLASSINWGAVRCADAADVTAVGGTFSGSSSGTSSSNNSVERIDSLAAGDPQLAAALKSAYESAACLYDIEEFWRGDDGVLKDTSAAGAVDNGTPAAGGSHMQEDQQRLLLSVPLQPSRNTGAAASYQNKQQQETYCVSGPRACDAEGVGGQPLDIKGETLTSSAPAPSIEGGAESADTISSSSRLLRALGSMELPQFLLQPPTMCSRSTSPAVGPRCSSSEETSAETAQTAGPSDPAGDVPYEVSFTDLLAGATAAPAADDTAFCRPSWQLQHVDDGSSSSSRTRTLLQALSEVPEEYGVFPCRRKGGHEKDSQCFAGATAPGAAAPGTAHSSAEPRYLTRSDNVEEGCGEGEGEEDVATKKQTLVSFLLSLLPDSESYAATAGSPKSATAGTAPLQQTFSGGEVQAGTSKSLDYTQALLNSLQGHLLRYGSDETAVEHQKQQDGAAVGGRRSRNGGAHLSSRAGAYGKTDGVSLAHHSLSVGRGDGGPCGALKREAPAQEEMSAAAAGGSLGYLSEGDPSRVQPRTQQHVLALRQTGLSAAADASDIGGDSEIVGTGSGCGSYSSLSESLGSLQDDILAGATSGGVNAQLLYRSTISGVVYDKSGQKWTARWSEYGRQHKKTFATAKYGFLHAKKRAEACRLEASRMMREGQGKALAAAARLAQVGSALQAESGSPGGVSAFSGLAVSAESAHTLQLKDLPPEGEQQQQLMPESQHLLLPRDLQQLQEPLEKEGLIGAAAEPASELLVEAQLAGPASAPPSKRRRHKLSASDT